MDIENEIISYLYEYGNTKESDIINYGVKTFDYPSNRMKKALKRMVIKGEVHYVVHDKLQPPEVYISLEKPLPPETAKILFEAYDQMKAAEKDVQNILEEAAAIAERKSKGV